jgi:hypothetical protein
MPLANNSSTSYYFTNQAKLFVLGYGTGEAESYYYLAYSAMRNLAAAFTANGISYNEMFNHIFCEHEIEFVAEIEEACTQPESVNWYIDDVHQPALTNLLTWTQYFPTDEYVIRMEVLFDNGNTKIYEGILKIEDCGQTCEGLDLYTTGTSPEGLIELEWTWLPPPPTGNYGFTLYQWDGVLGDWQTVSMKCDKEIQVLNVYPDAEESNNLQTWMNDPEIGLGKIIVTPVTMTNFNANPDYHLKGGGSEYIYDVVMFGTWDSNNGKDLTPASANAVKDFLDSRRGVLFGHDTQHWDNNFALLSDYINADILINDVGYFRGSERIRVVNDGFLLKYPHHLPYGDTLDIPCTHTSGQFAKGIIWMNFPEPQVGPCFHAPVIVQPNGGTNDFYLTTWNNAAMIQTGHSDGTSTLDERKVLANTLWYLAQFTTDTTATVCSALDLAPPDMPTTNRYDCNLIEILSKDNGSLYRFYVKATNITDPSDTCMSNILEVINKSGLKGFYILEDDNPNGVPEASNPATIFIAATDDQLITYTIQDLTKYIHIQAIDFAGNLSEVVTLEPLENCNCDPIDDFIVIQPKEGEVLFIWSKPDILDGFLGVRIIRDGMIIAPIIAPPTFSYTDHVSVGNHLYCLIGLYDNPLCKGSEICHVVYVYQQCDPVSEVLATVIGADKVQVSWMPTEALGFIDYFVYCDNVWLINTNQTIYVHENVAQGEHLYSVVVNYEKTLVPCTASDTTYSEPVFIETCVMAENLTVTEVTKESITITWTAAADVETFDVYRDNVWIANVEETTYTDKGVFAENVVYTYCVIPVYHTCQVAPACAEAYIAPCIPFNVTNVVAMGNKETKTAYITWDYAGADATFDLFKDNKFLANTANKSYTDNIEYDFIYKYCVAPVAECAGGTAACDTVLIDASTGITDPVTGLSIYPNPTNGELIVQSNKYRVESIEIFDMMGRKVQSLTFNVQSSEFLNFKPEKFPSFGGAGVVINISNFSSGIYFIRILTSPPSEGLGETGIITQKIIKR